MWPRTPAFGLVPYACPEGVVEGEALDAARGITYPFRVVGGRLGATRNDRTTLFVGREWIDRGHRAFTKIRRGSVE